MPPSLTPPPAAGPPLSFTCREGSASLEAGSTRVLRITMTGHVDEVVGRKIAAALSDALGRAPGPVETFWDLEKMDRYHSDVRVLCTQALLRNWSNVAGVNTLATSKLVKMGVAVANVALRGKLKNTESRAGFEALFSAAITVGAGRRANG